MLQKKSIQPGWNLEYIMFLFTRLSAVIMLIIALIGVVSAFLMGARTLMDAGTIMRWMFFPNPNHVSASVPDVEAGWSNAFWQIMEMIIVCLAATHGMNGFRVVLEETFNQSGMRLLIRTLIFLLWIFIIFIAYYVIQAS